LGLKSTVQIISKEIQDLYAMDDVPWIIGYSGGKDSTACVQLVWNALAGLTKKQRHKEVHVISTDTRVENPIVSQWVSRSLESMRRMAQMERIPIQPHQLKPEIADSFWVNLLGKGYPSPRHMFRWCTERMKIRPANTFISKIVQTKGEAILILGTRKQESIARARTMARHAQKQLRERLTPNASLHGSLIYTPIEDWSNDDVWTYLNQVANPWDYPNEYLLGMYAGATEGGECPLVIESNTPSCGDSRFGCWVCTLVDKDKSMSAMIQNDAEKEWMLPLLDLRNELDMRDQPGDKSGDGLRRDRERRDFRRMDGRLHMFVQDKDKDEGKKSRKGEELDKDPRRALVHGPYVQAWRERFLRKLLLAQVHVQTHGGKTNRDLEIISLPELEAIRRIWVVEKHEIEDSLPRIFKEVTGEEYPGVPLDDQCPLDHEVLTLLFETCEALKVEGEDVAIRYGLLREMLSVESGFRTSRRRAGLFEALEKAIGRHLFWSEQDAVAWAKMRRESERAFRGVNQAMQDMALVLSPEPEGEDEDGDASLGSGLPEAFS
jgi:DNA sulfur modification protein DndC